MRTKRLRRIGDVAAAVRVAENTKGEDIRSLLGHIHGFYEAALDLLPAEGIPSLAPRLLSAGVCFGVLDPVSNIIANTIAYSPSSNPKDDKEEGEEAAQLHTRESVMSRIITHTDDDVFDLPLSPEDEKEKRMTVAPRSLQGLVSFLIFYFRYLAGTEALRYLRLARADLHAAVRLIELDRNNSIDPQNGKSGFSVISITTKVAMACAAVSAKHPDPGTLVRTSLLLAARPRLDMASMYLPMQNNGSRLSPNLKRLRRFLKQEPKNVELTDPCYWQPLQLADLRYHEAMKRKVEELPSRECTEQRKKKRKAKKLPSGDSAECTEQRKKRKVKKLPSGHSTISTEKEKMRKMNVTSRNKQTLKLLLLDKIHAHYLEALARLPGDALRNSYHVGLLRAGFCYGPMDPVSNIILNTVWYATTFPTHSDFEVDFEVAMICTNMLRRIECGSLYGLVAFLCALFNTLTEHDAVWFLLVNNSDAALAIKMVEQQGHVMSGAYDDAYRNAARDSWHPDPDELLKLVMPLVPTISGELPFWMNNGGALLVEQFVMSLSPKCEEQVSQLNQAETLSVNQKKFMSEMRKKFQVDQEFFAEKANTALNSYAKKNGGHFEIHIICGVNPNVNKGTYSHINFWATAKGSNIAGISPVLFFAECSNGNDEDDEEEPLCFPVFSACICSVRCFHCEFHGTKIVHPYDEVYHGRSEDFDKMAHGDHGISNDLLISAYDYHVDMMCTLDEDWIYFDPKVDRGIAEKNPMDDGACRIGTWKGRIF